MDNNLSAGKLSFGIILLLMTAHAFLMNGHQHVYPYLTVGNYVTPILAKADPSLFKNSLYVQAVMHSNVRLTLFYDVSPFIVNHFDLETFSIVQEIISLGLILAGIYACTIACCGSRIAGYIAMLLYTAETNQWILGSPASYANFFHHGIPYAYPLMVWSLVFFLRQRYVLACLFAGISWNFHPMCTVFLLSAYFLYGLCSWREFTLATSIACLCAFVVPALPMIIKALSYLSVKTVADPTWLTVIRWTAWYTCFPSTWPLSLLIRAGLFFVLFLLGLWILPEGRIKRMIKLFILAIALLWLAGTVFAEWYPIPLILKLSLWRSSLLFLFLAMPCIAYLFTITYQYGFGGRFLVLATIILLSGYLKGYSEYYLPLYICFFIYVVCSQKYNIRLHLSSNKFSVSVVLSAAILFVAAAIADAHSSGSRVALLFFCATIIFLLGIRMLELIPSFGPYRKQPFVLLLLFFLGFDSAVLYLRGGPEIYYHGRVRGMVDPWADIQKAAQLVSEKDDLFIIPPYKGDFGIYSLRASLGDWAEGSHALYLGNTFADEWFSRMNTIGWKKFAGEKEGYNSLSTEEVIAAAKKYGAQFIISEKPKQFKLLPLYENDSFILYRTP